ncbi:hypothetical protein Emed_007318 [Eimeria media]
MRPSFCPSLRGLSAWAATCGLLGVFVACSRAAALAPTPQTTADSSPCAAPPAVADTGASAAAADLVKPQPWKKEQSSTPLVLAASMGRPRGMVGKQTMIAALSIALLSVLIRCIWVFSQVMTNCLTFFWGVSPGDTQEAAADIGQPPPLPSAVQVQQEAQQQEDVTSLLDEHPIKQEKEKEEDELQNLIRADLGSLTSETPFGSSSKERELPEETGRDTPSDQESSSGDELSQDHALEPAPPYRPPRPSSLPVASVWPSGNVSPSADRLTHPGDSFAQPEVLGEAQDLLRGERRSPLIQSAQEGASDEEESSGLLIPPPGAATAEGEASAAAQQFWGFQASGSPWTTPGPSGQPAAPIGGWGRQVKPFYGVPEGEPYSQGRASPPSPPPHNPFDFDFFRAVTLSLSADSGGDDADSSTS